MRTVDYSALTAPVTPAEVAEFRTRVRSRPEYASTSVVVLAVALILVLVVFGIFFLGTLGSVVAFAVSAADSPGAAVGGLVVPVILVAGFVVIAVVAIRSVAGGGRWERWLRLDRFATANGLVFSPKDPDPRYPGAIFQIGRSRAAVDHLRSASDRFLDYGNFRYTTGSGKNQSTRTWGFLALQLDRALPHMVLDSRANNGIFGSNLPAAFTKDQVLHLEGDFDRHFTLYCPKEYERDALYVFTPDLMALLIDNAAPFDVEIIDRWMFVYSSAAFDLRQPGLHRRLLGIVDTVGAKTLSQTDRYSDEKVGDFAANLVAPQGQRLKRGVSVGAVVAVVAVAVLWGWPFFGGLVSSIIAVFGR
ncbi:hypothetical protein BH09ACT5_BH09ACT5_01560 [soil metagenome]